MRRVFLLFLMSIMLAACSGGAAPATPPVAIDPLALLIDAGDKMRGAETFKITVDQTGPDYFFSTDYALVAYRRATGQYVAPGIMQASVRVLALGIPLAIDVYANGADQWYRALWTGNEWLNEAFQEGFNPSTLIAEETGVQAALAALNEVQYIGTTQLESGVSVKQFNATADGIDVAALLGGLIVPVGQVEVEVYLADADNFPARFVVREFNSPNAATPAPGAIVEPITWLMDIFDVNAPSEITPPEGA